MPKILSVLLSLLLMAAPAFTQELPLLGIAHVGFRVSDLHKARAFYTGVLGYEEAFQLKGAGPDTTLHYFKINDDQYVEISPGLEPGQDIRLTRISLLTSDIDRLRKMLTQRGLSASPLERDAGGNRVISLTDPNGHRLEFIQYAASSPQTRNRGKFLSERRISTDLRHTGVTVANLETAMAFYRDKLGFQEIWRGGPSSSQIRWVNMLMPGPRGDYIEFMLHDKPPTRSQLGSMHHLCLEVPDIRAAWRAAVARGLPTIDRHEPRIGLNRRWLMNIFDADGTRTEYMEPKTVD